MEFCLMRENIFAGVVMFFVLAIIILLMIICEIVVNFFSKLGVWKVTCRWRMDLAIF